MAEPGATVMAGIPAQNMSFYRRIRFLVGDPAALVTAPGPDGTPVSTLIVRDIELERARRHARADRCCCPRDFTPAEGLSGDRETATAQAAAECLRRAGVSAVRADRSLPLLFAEYLRRAGIRVECDTEMGVVERRAKDDKEIEHLREAQAATERVMRSTCEMIARATARADGVLLHDGAPLTTDRVNTMIDVAFLGMGYSTPGSIVACGPIGADCHHRGEGELRTGQPVIVDIFPRSKSTLYNGDCTRTVVHAEIPEALRKMHAAVVEAKGAATRATRAGVTGEQVHKATIEMITRHGYAMGLPPAGAPASFCSMQHGTGHGIGLDVHEPPLLDIGGPALVVGDALTIEPGLYCRAIGGVRVEDMVIVGKDGCRNLNSLPEGLTWA